MAANLPRFSGTFHWKELMGAQFWSLTRCWGLPARVWGSQLHGHLKVDVK
jgi:hypothetical protein